MTDRAALDRAVNEIATELGGLDHLVANAGGTVGSGNLTSPACSEFTATFALYAGHAAELMWGLAHLRAAGGGRGAHLLDHGLRPALRTAYAAAKAAEIDLAATAAAGTRLPLIRVNVVSPGSIMFPGRGRDTFRTSIPTTSPPSWPVSSSWPPRDPAGGR